MVFTKSCIPPRGMLSVWERNLDVGEATILFVLVRKGVAEVKLRIERREIDVDIFILNKIYRENLTSNCVQRLMRCCFG